MTDRNELLNHVHAASDERKTMLTEEQTQSMPGAPTTSEPSDPSLTKSPKWDQYPEGYMEDPEYYRGRPEFEKALKELADLRCKKATK